MKRDKRIGVPFLMNQEGEIGRLTKSLSSRFTCTCGDAMTVTKDNLIQSLYDQCGLSRPTSKASIETLFELIKKALESGDDVLISGFGKFFVRRKAPRRGRNPATGEDLTLGARTVVGFKCSGILKERVNGEG